MCPNRTHVTTAAAKVASVCLEILINSFAFSPEMQTLSLFSALHWVINVFQKEDIRSSGISYDSHYWNSCCIPLTCQNSFFHRYYTRGKYWSGDRLIVWTVWYHKFVVREYSALEASYFALSAFANDSIESCQYATVNYNLHLRIMPEVISEKCTLYKREREHTLFWLFTG